MHARQTQSTFARMPGSPLMAHTGWRSDFCFGSEAEIQTETSPKMPMRSLDDFAARKLAELDRACLRRTLAESFRGDGPWVERDGRRLLSFSCNDYLNLSHHPALKSAATAAIAQYGVGAGASRLVTGNHPLFRELEERLPRLTGTEAACVFGRSEE